jgi:hypothetical protein
MINKPTKMFAEINAYPIRKKPGFDVSKSRIFAFQKSINAIFNIESNDESSSETRHVLKRRIKPTQDDLWSKSVKVYSDSNIESNVIKSPRNYQQTCRLWVKVSNNMDTLLHYFYSIQDYPEYYLGKAEQMALCRCPQTGEESWNNGKLLLTAEPRKNMIVKAQLKIKNTIYEKDFIFVKWETEDFYEWKMKSGNILKLRQKFIDGLEPKDKKYLRMHT